MLNLLSNVVPLVSNGFDYSYSYTTTSTEADPAAAMISLLFTCCYFIFVIAIYAFTSYTMMKMAVNLGLEDKKIFAWIPILNIYLMVLMAKLDIIWFVLSLFVPFVSLYVWYEILTKRYGKDTSYVIMFFVGSLFVLPVFYFMWQLSNEKPKA